MAVNIDGDTGIDKVQPGTIDSADFGPGVITAPAIADSAVTAPKVAGADGSAGQYLQSDGDGTMSWITAAAGQLKGDVFTAPGTWTNPGNVTSVKVVVIGGGGGGNPATSPQGNTRAGGFGGYAEAIVPIPTSPVTITRGAGGAANAAGSTSSFGPYVSATGGSAGTPGDIGTPGTGSVSTGTTLRTLATPTLQDYMAYASGTPTNSGPEIDFSVTGEPAAGARGLGATPTAPSSGGVGGLIYVEYIG